MLGKVQKVCVTVNGVQIIMKVIVQSNYGINKQKANSSLQEEMVQEWVERGIEGDWCVSNFEFRANSSSSST